MTETKTATIIDGTAIAAAIREEVKQGVAALQAERGITPGLATVLVGENPASVSYVKSKRKTSAELGIKSFPYELPKETTQEEVIQLVRDLSANPEIHGILVQLPLPSHIDEKAVLGAVAVNKDVDGFHPINIGELGMKGRTPAFAPCTPAGVIELLKRTGVKLSGANAVVLGRSNIVGLPVALLLLRNDATVTVCHSRSQNLADIVRGADILIAAIGKARFVTGDMIKPGAVVIDVGMNTKPDATKAKGTRLCGDVHFESAGEVASKITPVPGGVGPMTIAMLLRNTVRAAERTLSARH